jgi:hypothetical protein
VLIEFLKETWKGSRCHSLVSRTHCDDWKIGGGRLKLIIHREGGRVCAVMGACSMFVGGRIESRCKVCVAVFLMVVVFCRLENSCRVLKLKILVGGGICTSSAI